MVKYTNAIKSSLAKLLLGKQQRWRFNEDGLATTHACDFMRDPRFLAAYAAGKATTSWRDADIHYRAYVVAWAAEIGAQSDGDFVECGVDRGGSAMVAATYTDFANRCSHKKFWLLDTFNGLDERYVTQQEKDKGVLISKAKRYTECYEQVKDTFKAYPNVNIVRGPIPETLSQVDSCEVAYLSIDMNCEIPEIAALEHFWPKLSLGAIVVLDDYGFAGHGYQKQAFDRFAKEHMTQVLALPTGQGLMVK